MNTLRRLAWFDVGFTVGLALITAGLCLWSLPLGIVVLGCVVCAVSVRAASIARTAPTASTSPSPHLANDRTADQLVA